LDGGFKVVKELIKSFIGVGLGLKMTNWNNKYSY